jgi:hypothetical protein
VTQSFDEAGANLTAIGKLGVVRLSNGECPLLHLSVDYGLVRHGAHKTSIIVGDLAHSCGCNLLTSGNGLDDEIQETFYSINGICFLEIPITTNFAFPQGTDGTPFELEERSLFHNTSKLVSIELLNKCPKHGWNRLCKGTQGCSNANEVSVEFILSSDVHEQCKYCNREGNIPFE